MSLYVHRTLNVGIWRWHRENIYKHVKCSPSSELVIARYIGYIVTSAKEFMFSPEFVCPSVCEQDNTKTYWRILIKFSGYVQNGKRKKWLDFGSELDHCLDTWIINWEWSGSLSAKMWNRGGNISANGRILKSKNWASLAEVCALWVLLWIILWRVVGRAGKTST